MRSNPEHSSDKPWPPFTKKELLRSPKAAAIRDVCIRIINAVDPLIESLGKIGPKKQDQLFAELQGLQSELGDLGMSEEGRQQFFDKYDEPDFRSNPALLAELVAYQLWDFTGNFFDRMRRVASMRTISQIKEFSEGEVEETEGGLKQYMVNTKNLPRESMDFMVWRMLLNKCVDLLWAED